MRGFNPAILAAGCAPEPLRPAVIDTIDAAPDELRLVALGDVGKGNASQRLVARAIGDVCDERGCDLLVLLGDNLYPRGMDGPDDPTIDAVLTQVYRPLGVPTVAVLGNHDYAHGRDQERAGWQLAWAGRQDWLQMPARTWSGRAGPVDLFAIDTTWSFWYGSEPQQSWLIAALEGSRAPWKVVIGHHPLRSNGPHGDVGAYEGLPGVPIASGSRVAPLLEALCGRADLYLSGHDHSLQWISDCGVESIVSGAGSSATALERAHPARFQHADEGFVWILLGPEGLTAAFYDEERSLLFEHTVPPAAP